MNKPGTKLELRNGNATILEQYFNDEMKVLYLIQYESGEKRTYKQKALNNLKSKIRVNPKIEKLKASKKEILKELDNPDITESEFIELSKKVVQIENKIDFEICFKNNR